MRYANHECAGCGRILPAYELAEVSDRVHTGDSRHERRIGHTPNFRHTGTTRHYGNRVKRLCFRCRISRFVGKIVVAGGGGLLFIAFAAHDGNSTSTNEVGAPNRSSAASADDAPALVVLPQDRASEPALMPGTSDTSSEGRGGADSASQPTVPAKPPAGDQLHAAEQIIADPSSIPEVEQAVAQAAQSGDAARWSAHGLQGYAVASSPGGGGCRMIQVSLDDGRQTTPVQRCPARNETAVQ